MPEVTVRSNGVVVPPPSLNEHLHFEDSVEAPRLQQLVPKLEVEALDVLILPG